MGEAQEIYEFSDASENSSEDLIDIPPEIQKIFDAVQLDLHQLCERSGLSLP